MDKASTSESLVQQTSTAFVWTRLLSMPFWTILSMFSIILYKDLHITPLQITTIVALKPISALFAPYWSLSIHQRQDRIVKNLIWVNVLRFIPFFFFPWIDSAWLMILSFCFFMMLSRGAIPAWMEMLKNNIPGLERERIFAYATTVDYCGSALLPILLGYVLDDYHLFWRWLFPLTACVGVASTLFLLQIPSTQLPESTHAPCALSEQLLKPWKQSWQLIKENPGFARFQVGFMLGGAGLMIMQPALPMFFVDTLNLSYTEMAVAIAACKGIGYAASSPLWLKFYRRIDIFSFSSAVTLLAAVFPFLLISAQYHVLLLYLAYGVYGIMQSGSEMSWHMSGPVFSKDSDSSPFSRTNVLTVGLRGCIFPLIGSCLYFWTNATTVMIAGAILCFIATQRLNVDSKLYKPQKV